MKYFTQKKTILMILMIGILMFGYIGKVSAADYLLSCVYDIQNKNVTTFPKQITVIQGKDKKWSAKSSKGQEFSVKVSYSGKKCASFAAVKDGKVLLLKSGLQKDYACEGSGYAADQCSSASYEFNTNLSDVTNATEESGNPREDTETTDFPGGNCGILGPKTIKILKETINLIRYIVPIIIILLGSLDFAKILFSGEEKVFRDAAGTFAKRLLIGVVFMFIPSIIELLVNLSGLLLDYDIDEVFCGLF